MNYLLKPQHQQGISISGKSRPSHQSNAIGRALVSITSISISFCLSFGSRCIDVDGAHQWHGAGASTFCIAVALEIR